MRVLAPLMSEALTGSAPDARVSFHAFYDGLLGSVDPLPVGPWSLKWSVRDQTMVRSSGSFTVGEGTGELAPWGLSEPLSAAGSQVSAVMHVGGESIDLATFTVTGNSPTESLFYARDRWNTTGASVDVAMEELSRLVQDDEFISPESPPTGATVMTEIERLLRPHVGVIFAAEVVDQTLPKMLHPESRLEAVYTLVQMVGDARFTGDGQLFVYVPNSTPTFTVQGKPMGNLVDIAREQSRDNFYNVVVSTGRNANGDELKAYAMISTGPLQASGPFGRRVYRHTAVATTQAGVQADADATLKRLQAKSTVEIRVEVTPDPSIEAGDTGTILFPAADGSEPAITGRVLECELSGSADGFDPMRLVMACPAADVQRVGELLANVRRNP